MEPQVFVGIDVGKSQHHATAVNQEGGVVHDKPLPQSEPKIQELLTDLVA
ncbi:MAG: IS110 family transposase, partial [Yaniella sp.]|nr:IS110 family transposase [Yaniella sp.]